MMKISYVMQSYLANDLTTGAKTAHLKFIRAVHSIQTQIYQDIELIIVADGCEITEYLYRKYFSTDTRIRLVYIDKEEGTLTNGKNYFRGLPRQIGRGYVTGEITTYLDADDVALPNHAKILAQVWKSSMSHNNEVAFCINGSWYDNAAILNNKNGQGFDSLDITTEPFEIKGLQSEWVISKIKPGLISYNTNLMSHVSDVKTKWQDTINGNEDAKFGMNLLAEVGVKNTFKIEKPIYIRCKAHPIWDI